MSVDDYKRKPTYKPVHRPSSYSQEDDSSNHFPYQQGLYSKKSGKPGGVKKEAMGGELLKAEKKRVANNYRRDAKFAAQDRAWAKKTGGGYNKGYSAEAVRRKMEKGK